jgi:hypothetical protein
LLGGIKMAFTSTITGYSNWGNKRVSQGAWTTDTTGGDIDTGLTVCEGITLQCTGSAAIADSPAIHETLPVAGSAITIVVTSGKPGNWRAWGY